MLFETDQLPDRRFGAAVDAGSCLIEHVDHHPEPLAALAVGVADHRDLIDEHAVEGLRQQLEIIPAQRRFAESGKAEQRGPAHGFRHFKTATKQRQLQRLALAPPGFALEQAAEQPR